MHWSYCSLALSHRSVIVPPFSPGVMSWYILPFFKKSLSFQLSVCGSINSSSIVGMRGEPWGTNKGPHFSERPQQKSILCITNGSSEFHQRFLLNFTMDVMVLYTDGSMQDCNIFIANALERLQSCSNPLKHEVKFGSYMDGYDAYHNNDNLDWIIIHC